MGVMKSSCPSHCGQLHHNILYLNIGVISVENSLVSHPTCYKNSTVIIQRLDVTEYGNITF
jgi:hypothetical protein